MRKSTSILAILLVLVTAVPRAHAQSATASQAVLDATVQQHVASTDAERTAVLRVLAHPEVKAVAGRVGVDITTATQAVSTVDGQELHALSAQAAQVEQALAGGQSKVVASAAGIRTTALFDDLKSRGWNATGVRSRVRAGPVRSLMGEGRPMDGRRDATVRPGGADGGLAATSPTSVERGMSGGRRRRRPCRGGGGSGSSGDPSWARVGRARQLCPCGSWRASGRGKAGGPR